MMKCDSFISKALFIREIIPGWSLHSEELKIFHLAKIYMWCRKIVTQFFKSNCILDWEVSKVELYQAVFTTKLSVVKKCEMLFEIYLFLTAKLEVDSRWCLNSEMQGFVSKSCPPISSFRVHCYKQELPCNQQRRLYMF